MQRKWEEKSKENLLSVICKASGLTENMFDRSLLLEGATEKDIVYAGLEEIMTSSTEEVITTSLNRKVDLRTAAYINAITRLDEFYSVTGVH
jgi:glutamate dehydrogenase (NAD(P)+)